MAQRYEHAGSVRINSENYRLVRLSGHQQAYTHDFVDEPTYAGGLPPMESEPTYTWHLGGFKSRQGIIGTSEYGLNTDGRWPFRLVPAPLINSITVQASASGSWIRGAVAGEGVGASYYWVCTTVAVYRIHKTTLAVVKSVEGFLGQTTPDDFGYPVQLFTWDGEVYCVAGNGQPNRMWKLTTINSGGPDTWSSAYSGNRAEITWAGKGNQRLFKVRTASSTADTCTLKNIAAGLDIRDEDNWADEVEVPGTARLFPGVTAYEKTAIARTEKGLFGVEEDGTAVNILKRLPPTSSSSVKGTMQTIEPYLYVSHSHGLFRWLPGLAESAGLEIEILNESPVSGQITAMASIGPWIFAGLQTASGVMHILVGRERRAGEQGFGPMVWDTLISFTGSTSINSFEFLDVIEPGWFGAGSGVLLLAFDYSDDTDAKLGYIKVPITGGAPEIDSSSYRFALSGTRYSVRYRWDDWRSKDFPKIVVVGEDVTASVYWDVAYSIDGGAWQTTDAAGSTMRVSSDGLHEFFLPTTASGREIQLRFTYTSNSSTACGKLLFYEPFAIPQSKKVPAITLHLLLEEGLHHDEATEQRTPLTQFADLSALVEQAAAVATYGPWGENKSANIRRLRIVQTEQEVDDNPAFIVELMLQLRETS